MSARPYQQCVRCVMDTSDPEIAFDEGGRCNHCTHFLERTRHRTYQGEETDRLFAPVLERIRRQGRGRPYDCVLGVSGGVDSCYALHVAVSLGLRPLAVHMDNGWNSDAAVKNIRQLTNRLGVDYRSWVLDWEEFRDLQLAFLRASVPEIETPTDIAIPAALHRVAAEVGARTVISGGNFVTEGILPRSWHYNAKDVTYLKAIHRRFGTRPLRTFPTFGAAAEAWYKLARGIRIVYLLNHVPYGKASATAFLQSELGWTPYGGKHHESRFTGFVQSYVLPVKFGIDYRRATLSTQICAGEVDRDEALAELEKPSYDDARVALEKEYVAKKLGVATAELEAILAQPPRTYRHYPNAERHLERLYRLWRAWQG